MSYRLLTIMLLVLAELPVDAAREQLPQDWAQTQNNLANALAQQGIRTSGAQGIELLAQAVAAFRSALEIYTHEDFPTYHEEVQENLAKAEKIA